MPRNAVTLGNEANAQFIDAKAHQGCSLFRRSFLVPIFSEQGFADRQVFNRAW
jgi:hypothetical protein